MDTIATLGLVLGATWVSGIRLYACVATLGLLGKFQLVQLPGQLTVLTDSWVIGVAVLLFVVEFFADKIAWLDSAWDAVHTFIRIPAGAALAWAAYAGADARVQVVAVLLGGGLALAAHGTKATVRAAVNHSPEPVSNVFVSLAEEVGSGALLGLSVMLPMAAIIVVVVALVVSIFLVRRIGGALRALYKNRRPNVT